MAVNPLLHQPTEPQIRLLETVQAGRELAGFPNYERTSTGTSGTVIPRRVGRPSQWPIFQYVETVMYRKHGLDARAVLAECPTVLIGLGPSRYGWLRSEKPNPQSLQPDDRVALTVAGMTHLPALGAEVEVFLEALAYLVAHEPSTWHCRVSSADGPGIWRLVLSPFLHPYTAIATAADYVDRVVQSTSLGMPELAPAYPSSLALAEAIDYFNGVLLAQLAPALEHVPPVRDRRDPCPHLPHLNIVAAHAADARGHRGRNESGELLSLTQSAIPQPIRSSWPTTGC